MNMKMKNFFMICLICSIMLMLPGAVSAQEENKKEVFELGEVVVTGSAEAVSQITTINTISREELELNNSIDISAALDNLPGVAVTTGSRNEAYINIRGFSQRYVPILFDGIPWYVPYDGYVDASELSTGSISRVSLTKGAASSLYGANTMGGVINIISRKPQKLFEGTYGLTGNNNGWAGNVNIGSKIEKFYIMGGFTFIHYDDFRMSGKFRSIPQIGGWTEDGDKRDNSDIESQTLHFKAGFTPSEDYEFAVGFHNIDSEKGMPTNVDMNESQRFWRASDWDKTTYYFIGNMALMESLSAKVRLYHDEYYNVFDAFDDDTYSTQFRGSSWHSTYDDHTDGVSITLRSDFIDKNIISFAYHLKNDVHESQGDYNDPWEKYEGRTSSYGLEDAVSVNDNLDVVLGVNMDVQEAKYNNGAPTRGDDESWNFITGFNYLDGKSRKYHFSMAKKSRFPTLKELYSSYMDTGIPNPNLGKEQSMNYEAGIQSPLPLEKTTAGVTIFYSDVEDLIVGKRVMIAGNRYDKNENIGESRFQGLEFSLSSEWLAGNSINLSYTYLDAENRSPGRTSDLMEEAPKHQLTFSDLITLNDYISFYTNVKYNRTQYEEIDSGWINLGSYWLVDMKAIVKIPAYNVQLELGVKNYLDKNYETSYGFPREGNTFFCGIKGSW